jgi:hypothetical protein
MADKRVKKGTPEALFRKRLTLVAAMLSNMPENAPVRIDSVHDQYALRMVMLSMAPDIRIRMYLLSTALYILSNPVHDVTLHKSFDVSAAADALGDIAADIVANRPVLSREVLTYARKVYAVLSLMRDNTIESYEGHEDEALWTTDLNSDADRCLRSADKSLYFGVRKSSVEALRECMRRLLLDVGGVLGATLDRKVTVLEISPTVGNYTWCVGLCLFGVRIGLWQAWVDSSGFGVAPTEIKTGG